MEFISPLPLAAEVAAEVSYNSRRHPLLLRSLRSDQKQSPGLPTYGKSRGGAEVSYIIRQAYDLTTAPNGCGGKKEGSSRMSSLVLAAV